jgi:hypothetical protein
MIDSYAIDGKTNGGQHPASAGGFVTPSSQDASHPTSTVQNPTAQAVSTPEDSATAAEKAVRAATVELNVWQRFWVRFRLRLAAWHAKRTGPETWSPRERFVFLVYFVACLPISLPLYLLYVLYLMFTHRSYPDDDYEAFFNLNAFSFGSKIKRHIPSRLKRRLKGVIDGRGEPFLVVRGVFSRRFPQASLIRKLEDDDDPDLKFPNRKKVGDRVTALLEKGHYNLVASALIAATETELRRKLDKDAPYRDYLTETTAEINQFIDGTDMHLRYRTATPEMPPVIGGENTAARIIVFACIENPIADPIYLIRVDDVIDELSARDEKSSTRNKNLLREQGFSIFDKWNAPQLSMQPGPNPNACILHDGPSETDWLSFDPNRICPATMDAVHNSAIGALMESIQKVAATRARKIVLRRGDALIVDNYRALTRRQQHGYEYFVVNPPWMRNRPPIRWLRVYYGFPKKKMGTPRR